MICNECGKEIPNNLKFCKYCGAPVKQDNTANQNSVGGSVFCKACGAPLKEGVAFCTQCGTPVGSITPASNEKKLIRTEKKPLQKTNGRTGKIIVVVLTIISLALIGVIAVYFAYKNGLFDKRSTKPDTETTSSDVSGSDNDTDNKENADSEAHDEAMPDNGEQNRSEGLGETDVDSQNSEVDLMVEEIDDERDTIIQGIASGKYNKIQIDMGIVAYIDGNNGVVAVSADRNHGNDSYNRDMYYENGDLIYAEYIGDDLQNFYYYNDEMIRWRFCSDVSSPDNGTNYDRESTTSYVRWDQTVREESSMILDQFEDVIENQSAQPVGDYENIADQSPFYGVWCAASKDASEAEEVKQNLVQQGFEAKVFNTADWGSLNSESWYAVTAGVFDTEKKAKKTLKKVKGNYPDAYVRYSGEWNKEYIIADSDKRYITEDDLKTLTQDEVRTALNELYARHGRKFTDPTWQEYFNSKSWYEPMIDPEDFSDSTFNRYELENKKFIVKWEEDHGWR